MNIIILDLRRLTSSQIVVVLLLFMKKYKPIIHYPWALVQQIRSLIQEEKIRIS